MLYHPQDVKPIACGELSDLQGIPHAVQNWGARSTSSKQVHLVGTQDNNLRDQILPVSPSVHYYATGIAGMDSLH